MRLSCDTKFLRELAIFGDLRDQFFAIRTDWFFLLGIKFCYFQKVPNTYH